MNAKWYTYMFIIAYQERYVRLVAQLSMGRAPSFRRQQLSNNIVRTGEPRPHWGWAAPCKVSHRPPRRDTVLGPARGAARRYNYQNMHASAARRRSDTNNCRVLSSERVGPVHTGAGQHPVKFRTARPEGTPSSAPHGARRARSLWLMQHSALLAVSPLCPHAKRTVHPPGTSHAHVHHQCPLPGSAATSVGYELSADAGRLKHVPSLQAGHTGDAHAQVLGREWGTVRSGG